MRLLCAALCLILAVAALPAQADEPVQPGNAAVHYWCAVAVMKRPANDQEEKVLDYIEEWSFLPPKVFIERDDAVYFLKEDLERGGTMDIIHVGAECPLCDFDTDGLMAEGWLPPVGLLRHVGQRGCAAVSVLEGQGDMLRAAQLHADLLQFSAHLCQCPQMLYALSGTAVLRGSLEQMEALLALKPGPDVLRALMDRFNRIPPNPLSFTRCWLYLAKFQPSQLKKETHLTDKDLDETLESLKENDWNTLRTYGPFGPEWKTIALTLRSKKLEERQALVESWATQLGQELNAVAKAGEAPLAESEPRVRLQVERMRRLAMPADAKSMPRNPFLAMWTELPIVNYATCARYNATLEMGRILCAAALFEAETGGYPTSLDALAKYFPAGLPKDPYTGRDFLYSLEEGLPCVKAQPSASLRQELQAWDCRMSMAQILTTQAERLERYRKEVQSPAPGAHD